MKIIDCSPLRDEEGNLGLLQTLNGILDYGFKWQNKVQAADQAIKRLQRTLGKDYMVFRDFSIPGIDPRHCAMILVGPQGILAVLASPLKGIYRAKGTEWMSFDQRARKFKKSKPNYQDTILGISSVLKKALEGQGLTLVDIESVLIFTNPRTLIDTARPRVRVVPADAVDYFAANLEQLPEILDKEDISYLKDILLRLTKPSPEENPVPEAEELQAEPVEESPSTLSEYQDSLYSSEAEDFGFPDEVEESTVTQPGSRFRFQRRQWLILGFLFIIEVLILAVFALLIIGSQWLPF